MARMIELIMKARNRFLHDRNMLAVLILKRIHKATWLIERRIRITRETPYVPLTPTPDCDKENTYSDALSWALAQDSITNIAITGSYGSGKSSVIKKFQKQNPQFKYINISLACFNEKTQAKEQTDCAIQAKTDNIELSILQQISYFVKNKHVKDSRISRIRKLTWINLLIVTSFYGVGLFFMLSLFFQKNGVTQFLRSLVTEIPFVSQHLKLIYGLIIIYVAIFLMSLMWKLVRYLTNTSLSKVKLHGGEIELSKYHTPSVLNQYLDEILYFFEANKTDIVVIEDLDRYELVEIFSKLREINHLINKSKQINYKTVFIYAVKDDILKEHNFERTKFFDFIIPIVPVINTSNSVDILLKRLKSSSVQVFNDRFIKDISLYISDMRLLNNVVNEFLVYQKMLEPGLNADKMFAMILYKNLMPSDFVEMLQNEGVVCDVFRKKEELIEIRMGEINAKILAADKDIKKHQEHTLNDIKELHSVYLFKIFESLPGIEYFKCDGIKKEITEINNEEFFEDLNKGVVQAITKNRYGENQPNQINFKSIEEAVSNQSYQARLNIIKSKLEGRESTLLKSKSEWLDRLKRVEGLKVQEYDLNANDVIFKDLDKVPAVIYMIRYGYIDEDYHRYISFFYEGSRTRNDEDFLKSIKDGSKLTFNHPIDHIDIVLGQLFPKDFSQKEILNNMLIDHLFKAPAKFPLQIESILKLLLKKGKETYPFIEQYLENGQQQANFFNALGMNWTEFWSFLEYDIEISEAQLEKFLVCFIQYLKPESVQNINVSNVFADYIANKTNLAQLLLKEGLNRNAKKIIKALDIKINEASSSANQEFEDYIYHNNNYKIYYENLRYYLNRDKSEGSDGQLEPNYSTIKAHSDNKMFEYIAQHLNDYLQNVFLLHDDLTDAEEIFVELLNHEGVDRKIKSQIINKKEFKVWDVNTIEDISVIDELLQYGRIEADWENMISMFNLKDEKLDNYLVGFLNRKEVYIELSKLPCKLVDESGEIQVEVQDNEIDDSIDSETNEEEVEETNNDVVEKLSEALVLNKSLSIEAYKSLMRSIVQVHSELDISVLDIERRTILVSRKILVFSKVNLDWLSENEELYLKFIADNKDRFAKEYGLLQIPMEKVELILTSLTFPPEQQVLILNQFDLSQLTNLKIANEIIKYSVTCDYAFPLDTILILIKRSNIVQYRAILVKQYITHNKPTHDTISRLLKIVSSDHGKLVDLRKRPTLKKYKHNIDLLTTLEQVQYISSFEVKEDRIKVINRYL
jgi:hypothetical protein